MGTNLNRRYKKILAPVVILLMIVFVWKKTGIFFESNDDKLITEILSGVQTGTPNAHVGYVSYLLTLPISLLYHVTNKVPWYGLFLILLRHWHMWGFWRAFTANAEILRRQRWAR